MGWDSGKGSSTNIILAKDVNASTLKYQIASGLTSGSTYIVRVYAQNIFGQSSAATLSINAAGTPSAPASPTVSYSSANVTITWNAPTSNGGSSITSYKVQIKGNDGSYHQTASCSPGSSLTCSFSLSVLTSSPFSLPFDTLIEAQVAAANSIGFGNWSPANTSGAKI